MPKTYSISGSKALLYGDLHLSAVYEGQHKDYLYECYTNMSLISDRVIEERPCAVFFLGDIVGVRERNIRDPEFFLRVYRFFKTLNEVTDGNVYSVRGNHDMGEFTDFDVLMGMDMIKNPDYVDYLSEEGSPLARFHLVNYGDESRDLEILEGEGTSNVVLGHNDYFVDGVTNWYLHKNGVELASLSNFDKVETIISGHIHNPSTELITAKCGTDSVDLFYTGSPARTAERYDDCWYLSFLREGEKESQYITYEANFFGLESADEVFYPKEDFELSEEEEAVAEENKKLSEIVKNILESRIASGDLFDQINRIPGFKENVRGIASRYLKEAMND